MSKIIFLNGPGSSGKTSIAKSLIHLGDELWLTYGVDTFIDMLPFSNDGLKAANYFKFVSGKNEYDPTMRVDSTPKGNQFFSTMPDFAKLLADKENNIIIDEVLFTDEQLNAYARKLIDHTVYYIGIFCTLEVMQEREILRGNRHIGLSNDQSRRVHVGQRKSYDLEIDTTTLSSFDAATQILDYIKNNPKPQSFRKFLFNDRV